MARWLTLLFVALMFLPRGWCCTVAAWNESPVEVFCCDCCRHDSFAADGMYEPVPVPVPLSSECECWNTFQVALYESYDFDLSFGFDGLVEPFHDVDVLASPLESRCTPILLPGGYRIRPQILFCTWRC